MNETIIIMFIDPLDGTPPTGGDFALKRSSFWTLFGNYRSKEMIHTPIQGVEKSDKGCQ